MKTLISILVFLFAGIIFSQSVPDSTQIKKENQKEEQIKNQKTELQEVQKQTGPKENQMGKGKLDRKRKDVFIDKDGDGICDSRQSGMSFNKVRKRIGSGKSGPHNGSGGSGNQNGSGNGSR